MPKLVEKQIIETDLDTEFVHKPGAHTAPDAANQFINTTIQQEQSELSRHKGTGYEREIRLQIIQKLLLRNYTLARMATHFGLSVAQISKDVAELRLRMREQVAKLDINSIIGENLNVLDQTIFENFLIVDTAIKGSEKATALKGVVSAISQKRQIMASAGVFDALKFRKMKEAANANDLKKLAIIAKAIAKNEEAELTEEELQALAELKEQQEITV